MKLHTRRGFGNALLRKVRKHSAFATLFTTMPTSPVMPKVADNPTQISLTRKTIVQASLAKANLIDGGVNLPLATTGHEYPEGMTIPLSLDFSKSTHETDTLDNTQAIPSQSLLPVNNLQTNLSSGPPVERKKSIWQRWQSAVRPKKETAPKNLGSPTLAASVSKPPAVHAQPSSLNSTPIHSQRSQTSLPPEVPGHTPVTIPPEKSGLSADDWRVLQTIQHKHQEKARQDAAGEVSRGEVQPPPAQKRPEILNDTSSQLEANQVHREEKTSQKTDDEEKTSSPSMEFRAKTANPILQGLKNIFGKKPKAEQRISTPLAHRVEIKPQADPPTPAPKIAVENNVQMSLSKDASDAPTTLVGAPAIPISPPADNQIHPVPLEKSQSPIPTLVGRAIGQKPAIEVQPPPKRAASPTATKGEELQEVDKSSASPGRPGHDQPHAIELQGEVSDQSTPQRSELNISTKRSDAQTEQESPGPQPRPLEEIWPVEEVQSKKVDTAIGPAVAGHETVIIGQTRERTAEMVQRRLEKVSTGEPTDSSVEVVAPRRPRPPQKAQEQLASIQKKPVPGEMVHTDIGELPADLWHLIGETPPIQNKQALGEEKIIGLSQAKPESESIKDVSAVQRSAGDNPPSEMADKFAAQTLIRETAHIRKPAPVQSIPGLGTIQRETVQSEAEASETKPIGATKNNKGEGIDIEVLSNQVFREVKRRLNIEWERTRRI